MYLRSAQGYGSLIPGSEYIRSLVRQGTISKGAVRRLRWMDHYAEHGNARLTCRYFGISPQSFYRWKNRYDPYDLTTLEEESRRRCWSVVGRPGTRNTWWSCPRH